MGALVPLYLLVVVVGIIVALAKGRSGWAWLGWCILGSWVALAILVGKPSLHTPGRTPHPLWGVATAGAAVAVIIPVALSRAAAGPTVTPAPSPSASSAASSSSAAVAQAVRATPAKPLTDSDWVLVQGDPGSYTGRSVSLGGQVVTTNLPGFPGGTFDISMHPDNPDPMGDVLVVPPVGSASIPSDAFVEVGGTFRDEQQVRNAMGATFFLPEVVASSVHVTTYGQVFAPALKTIEALPAQTQNGLTLTVTKVSMAQAQTRVWLTLDNRTGAKVVADTTEAALVQGTRQMQTLDLTPVDPGYPQLPDQILDGVVAKTVLIFPALAQGGGQVAFDLSATSDNFNQNWNDFIFRFQP